MLFYSYAASNDSCVWLLIMCDWYLIGCDSLCVADKIIRTLGEGTFGKVVECLDLSRLLSNAYIHIFIQNSSERTETVFSYQEVISKPATEASFFCQI